MQRNDIAALAKGMVPFVRECVAEAYSKTLVPPEIAEQVASAVRMLHESPVIPAKEMPQHLPPRITSIGRDADGNLVPIYDDQSL